MKNIMTGILCVGLLLGIAHTNEQVPFLEKSKSVLIEKATALAEGQKNLSGIQGMGRVRNLKVALILSPELQALYKELVQSMTKPDQMAKMDEFLQEWSVADSFTQLRYEPDFIFPTSFEYAQWEGSDNQVRDFDKFYIYDEYFVLMNPDPASVVRIQEKGEKWMVKNFQISEGIIEKIKIINAFSGLKERQFYFRDDHHLNEIIAQIYETYDAIAFMVYLQLSGETRLAKYNDLIDVNLTTFALDYSKVIAAFEEATRKDLLNGTVDLYEFLAQGHGQKCEDGMNLLNKNLVAIEQNGTKKQFDEMLGRKHVAFYRSIGFTASNSQ